MKKRPMKKKKITEEEALILECWLQFAYGGGKDGKRLWAGGLSILESCESYLRSRGIINSWGNKSKNIVW